MQLVTNPMLNEFVANLVNDDTSTSDFSDIHTDMQQDIQ